MQGPPLHKPSLRREKAVVPTTFLRHSKKTRNARPDTVVVLVSLLSARISITTAVSAVFSTRTQENII